MFRSEDRARVASGEITVSFRLWKNAHVKAGKTYPSYFGGQVRIIAVDVLPAASVSDEDLRLSGCRDVQDVWHSAGDHTQTAVTPDTLLHRVEFCYFAQPPEADAIQIEIDAVLARLARMDASSQFGPWTQKTLALIEDNPGLVARKLLLLAGRDELQPFKADVRKLKALGLTLSKLVGYELTENGRLVLQRMASEPVPDQAIVEQAGSV